MTLRRKILIGNGVTLALMSAGLIWSIVHLSDLARASNGILRDNYASILAAENMIDAIERQDSATLLVLLGRREEGLELYQTNESRFLQWLARGKDNITIAGEAEVVRAIEDAYGSYLDGFSRLRDAHARSPEEAGDAYQETVRPAFELVREKAVELARINHDTMFAASQRAESVGRNALWSTAAVGLGAVVVGILFSLLLSTRLARPIQQVIHGTSAIARGDYEARVPARGSDELARLAEGFNTMAGRLAEYHRLNVGQILAEKQKIEAVLRSIDDGLLVVGPDLCVSTANPQALRILGAGVATLEGRHFLEVVKDDRLFDLVKRTTECGEAPELPEDAYILSIGPEDDARHYHVGITPVLTREGALPGVVLLLRDVTRFKELDRLKSEFVMTASHELKTPLHTLKMSIALLEESAEGTLDDAQRRLLAAAGEEVSRLNSLVADLLDLSRIEAGKMELDLDRVPPSVLVEKALSVFREQAQAKMVSLSSDVPDDVPEVRADANKTAWVLSNLIANALRYAESGIRVAVRHSAAWVHLSVTDDGEGIPLDKQPRIFEKFVQAGRGKDAGGTGLGLAICREIVRAHRGTIWVESTPGEGTTFTFTLPTADAPKGELS